MRLTAAVRQQLLDQNEGFSTQTSYSGSNLSSSRTYTISGGQLHIHSSGNTSWADSRFDEDWVADDEETHRFLAKYKFQLNTDGIE